MLIGFGLSIIGMLVGTFIRGYFSNRDKKQDKLENFKDETIKENAVLSTKVEALTNGLSKLEGKVEQNTEILTKHVQLMDHVSRQLKRLFEVNGLRKGDKEEVT